MKVHDFEIHGGAEIIEGKSKWPDCVNIKMNRYQALNLAEQIIRFSRDINDKELTIGYCGKLDYDIDEEA